MLLFYEVMNLNPYPSNLDENAAMPRSGMIVGA